MSGVSNEVFGKLDIYRYGYSEVGMQLTLPCTRVQVPVVFLYLHGQP